MMRRFDATGPEFPKRQGAQQTRRFAQPTGRKIGSRLPNPLTRTPRAPGRAVCGAAAGKSAHGPMT
jgi:hypothetical protein